MAVSHRHEHGDELAEPPDAGPTAAHYYSGLTRQEVAAALGVPPGTVASRLALAQRVMRAALQRPSAASAAARTRDEASA